MDRRELEGFSSEIGKGCCYWVKGWGDVLGVWERMVAGRRTAIEGRRHASRGRIEGHAKWGSAARGDVRSHDPSDRCGRRSSTLWVGVRI